MKWNEAEKQGFTFTGATWSKWDEKMEKHYKEQAANLKKKYKGADYRIVTDRANSWLGNDSKALMGNDIYMKVQYFNQDSYEKRLTSYNNRKLELQKEYEAKLAELEAAHEKDLEFYNEILALQK